MWHLWERIEIHTGFWWGNLKERAHLADIGVDGRIILNSTSINRMGDRGLIDVSQNLDK